MTEQRKTFIPDENETIIQMEIERLKTFKDHPFKVENDDEMKLLKESIEKYGVLNPLIVRPLKEGVYEIISGHRRKFAAEELGYRKIPVIIRVMKDEAMKRVRGRKKKGQVDDKLRGKRTIEIIASECGESYKQIQRYIKITELHPQLMNMLDNGEISFNPAVEISSLNMKEQEEFIEANIVVF